MPPLLVTALTTPPSAPPYSAEMPLVLTWTSCRYSNTVFWRDAPLTSELVTMPSTVNEFSAPLAPLTWMPPSISPWLTDGALKAIDWNERPFGRRSNSSALTLCAMRVLRVSTSGVASPTTCTVSVWAPTFSWVLSSNSRPEQNEHVGALGRREAAQLEPDGVAAGNEVRGAEHHRLPL